MMAVFKSFIISVLASVGCLSFKLRFSFRVCWQFSVEIWAFWVLWDSVSYLKLLFGQKNQPFGERVEGILLITVGWCCRWRFIIGLYWHLNGGPHYCWIGVGLTASPWASNDTTPARKGRDVLSLGRTGSLCPTWSPVTLPGWDGERIGLENSVPDLTSLIPLWCGGGALRSLVTDWWG